MSALHGGVTALFKTGYPVTACKHFKTSALTRLHLQNFFQSLPSCSAVSMLSKSHQICPSRQLRLETNL